ncbi:hypothetical protein F2Q70_00028043 [Brassica cretica]|uniref:Uncharacterized protein n=2 Tax=Brassica cretica TaxID=69181 RepID=A0A8S9LEG1_BRACR|nr:hypothetical protein F2Q68_00027628 [Brassica cretica]KAF2604519.1 hypothetical protein F2Q70_00028043 [Brassica cretica]KAF3576592.1 hypothetical protein DY000_02034669 [Brassica cretica]
MSFGNSHRCRSTPREEHRSMESDEHRPTHPVQHRSAPSMESIASCETVRIMTHEEFTARHLIHLSPTVSPRKTSIGNTNWSPIDIRNASEPMMVEHAIEGRTLRKKKEKVPKHLKRGANEKDMDNFTKRVLRIPMDKPFTCYSDSGAKRELDGEISIDTPPEPSLDCRFEATIDRVLEALINSDPTNEVDDFPEGSIDSWENDYYQPSFAIHIVIPSRRKIRVVQPDEHGVYRDEDGNAQVPDGRIINVSKEDI